MPIALDETVEGRAGRCQRHLLLEHEQHERGETRLARPQRRRAVLRHDRAEIGVALRQLRDGPQE